jgi:Tetraacyldisaccharide-1-P 4''-kinase
MLKAPKFWYKKNDTYLSNSLYPLSLLFRFGTKIRNFVRRKTSSEIPVICTWNVVVGGAGKTPVALKLKL